MQPIQEVAFPTLSKAEFDHVKSLATACDYADGETVFHAGDAEVDLYIVESGQIEIRNPTDGGRLIVELCPTRQKRSQQLARSLALIAGVQRLHQVKGDAAILRFCVTARISSPRLV